MAAVASSGEFPALIHQFLKGTAEQAWDSDSEHNDGNYAAGDLDLPQQPASVEKLCRALVVSLQNTVEELEESDHETSFSSSPGTSNTSSFHIRTVLGTAAAETNALTETLTHFISQRQENVDHLMPSMQNTQTNQAVLLGQAPAVTLLPEAFAAAELYAQLAALPGALGVGWIQLPAISALVALLKRWKTEVTASYRSKKRTATTTTANTSRNNHKRQKKSSNSKRSTPEDDEDYSDEAQHGHSQPLSQEDHVAATPISEAEQWASNKNKKLSHSELVEWGLRVCKPVSQWVHQREFASWSNEAKECVWEATTLLTMVSAALSDQHRNSKALSTSLNDLQWDPSASQMERHEMCLAILRGIYPSLVWREELPGGEAGKQAAAKVATRILKSMISTLSLQSSVPTQIVDNGDATSPSTEKENADMSIAVTPKSSRKSRRSFGTSGGARRKSSEFMSPPRLKTPHSSASQAHPHTAPPKSAATRKNSIVVATLSGFLQKLATDKAAEKTSVRATLVQTILSCLPEFSNQSFFLKFLIQLTHSKVHIHRLMACELVGSILTEDWLWDSHAANTRPGVVSWILPQNNARRHSLSPLVDKSADDMPLALFGALQGRISDRVPTVRSAAMATLKQLLESLRSNNTGLQKGMLDIVSEEAPELVCMLRVRASLDDKSLARRSAVEALAELLMLAEGCKDNMMPLLAEDDIIIFVDRCKDASIIVRKAAGEALTNLLHECLAANQEECLDSLTSAWASSVLPMVLDSETSVSTRAIESTHRMVLKPLLLEEEDTKHVEIAWHILATLGGGPGRTRVSRAESEAMCKAISGILEKEDSKLSFLKHALHIICSVAEDTSTDPVVKAGAWSLANALVNTKSVLKDTTKAVKAFDINLSCLGTAWEDLLEASKFSSGPSQTHLRQAMQHSIHVMSKLAPCVNAELAESTRTRIIELLSSFSILPEAIGPTVAALTSLTIASLPNGNVADHKAACEVWIKDLFTVGEKEMIGYLDHSDSKSSTDVCIRSLCMVGEMSMVGFSPTEDDGPATSEICEQDASAEQIVLGLRVKYSKKLSDLVQVFMGKNSGEHSIPAEVRAHAFLTFGKFCLRDAELAKESLNLLARELKEGGPTVQSNCLVILGDLCVKYTNLVDRYLPMMASCLQSGVTDMSSNIMEKPASNGFAAIRKNAVILLSSLIMQDYIKWRGLLFHRFLVATSDEDEDVAEIAEAVLSGPLRVKQPRLFFNNFVESFFVLNCCKAHPMYVAAAASGDGGSGISVGFDGINLKGESGRVRRLQMYELMLAKMTDHEKIEATGRIAKEILGGALVVGSDLYKCCVKSSSDESAFAVMSDALSILRSKQIRVGRRQSQEDDIDDPNNPNNAKRKAAAMNRLLSNVSRKHLVETVLPILCNLKVVLQKHCSPLLKDLMSFIVDMYKLYKAEVKEFLANDPSLLQEIEYDARRHAKQQSTQENDAAEDENKESDATEDGDDKVE